MKKTKVGQELIKSLKEAVKHSRGTSKKKLRTTVVSKKEKEFKEGIADIFRCED